MDFNFQFNYEQLPELIFNFGSEIVIIDFINTPYDTPISDEICFDFGGVIAEPEIVGVATFTFSLTGETNVSFIVPSTKWLIGEVCTTQSQPEKLSSSTKVTQSVLTNDITQNYIPVESTTPLANEICFELGTLLINRNEWCFGLEQTIPENIVNCLPIEIVYLQRPKWCWEHEQATILTVKNLTEYTPTVFERTPFCFKMEFAGGVLHEDKFNYYPENHDLYSPSANFDLNHSSNPVVFSQNTGYVSENEPCFDFTEMVWSQPFDFTEGNDAIDFFVHPDFVPEYTPVRDFITPYNSTLIVGIPQHNLGVLSSETCFSFSRGGTLRPKFCLDFEQATQPLPGTSVFVDPPLDPFVDPPNVVPYTIPTAENYFMSHSISVTLENLTVIDMTDISITENLDQHSLSFSAQLLDKSKKDLIIGTPNAPIIILVTVNSELYKIVCNNYTMTEDFGVTTVNVSGRGHSILLDNPYVPVKSATQSSLLTIQQLVDSLIPIGSGWTVIWEATVWNIPSGTFSYTNKSPIEAMLEICNDIGAVLIPHHSDKTITIKPRYPVLPWNFALATANITIPLSVVPSITRHSIVDSDINGVYVHGVADGGKLAFVRLTGTAGDVLAPTVTSSLMTDAIGLRALSERILAAHSTQPEVDSFSLGMDGNALPLIRLGQLADIGGIRGIVNSVSLSATFSKVRQSINIGEKTSNDYTFFKTLLPKDPLLVATIGSVNSGTSLVTFLDGGIARVLGTGNIAESYYVQSGRLQASAPNLPLTNIIVG